MPDWRISPDVVDVGDVAQLESTNTTAKVDKRSVSMIARRMVKGEKVVV